MAAIDYDIYNSFIDSEYVLSSMITALVDDSKTFKSIQVDASNSLSKDLAQLYSDGKIYDYTIAVPKTNREFKASLFTIIWQFQDSCTLQASQWLLSAHSLTCLSAYVRCRHGGGEEQTHLDRRF